MQPHLYLVRLTIGLLTVLALSVTPAMAQEHPDASGRPAAHAGAGEVAHGEPAGVAEQGEEVHGEPNILAGDFGNIFFTLLIFLIVVFLLGKYAWKPVLNVLQERENTIRESLEHARREREEANRVLEKYTRQIEQARTEARGILDIGRRNAEEVRRRIQVEAREGAGQLVERAKREIRLATDAAKKEVYDLAAELAVDVAGRIIRKKLSAQDHKDLVAESLERMRAEDAKMN